MALTRDQVKEIHNRAFKAGDQPLAKELAAICTSHEELQCENERLRGEISTKQQLLSKIDQMEFALAVIKKQLEILKI